MVLVSLAALAVSSLAVWSLVNTVGQNTEVQRLQVTDPPAAVDAVWLEIEPIELRVAEIEPAAVAVEEVAVDVPRVEPVAVPIHNPAETKQFNGRPVKSVTTLRMLVTGYCPCSICCGKHANGRTAAGYSVWTNGGKLVAADTNVLPFGSLIEVPGYASDAVVPVLDRGGKIKGKRLDLLFPTHRQARQWGRRWLDVVVYDYAD